MAEPLHILVVIDNFYPLVGGAEHAALESARALAARGHRVDVLTLRKQPDWPAEERLDNLNVFRFKERIPPRPFGRWLYERANAAAARRHLDKRLAEDSYDVMLLHPIDAAFGVARARGARDAVLIYCFHAPLGQEHWQQERGLLEDETRLLRKMAATLAAAHTAHYRASEQRKAVERADAVTCPSEYARELLFEMAPQVGRKRVKVIPWGVDAARFCPADDRQGVRAALGWEAHELVVFTARRLVPRMGLGQLVRGFGMAAARQPRMRLVVAGVGLLRDRIEALAKRAGGRIDFVGMLPEDQLPRYFQGADLFVLPSRDLEAFGLVILEALACGTPVLATRRCAAPEILAPLGERLLIPRDDAKAIADFLLETGVGVAEEPGFRERCRAYVVERYSWERTAAALEELARQLLAERRGS